MRILGLDGGIASIGWAMLELDANAGTGTILGAGSWMFDAPETDKERTPTNALRRQHRGQRRVIRRRRQRMAGLRRLFAEHGLIADAGRDALRIASLDPWALRVDGLDRALTPAELAVALGHIGRHRGFRSNSKRDRGNKASETSKMLGAIGQAQGRLARWRSVAEMLVKDPAYAGRRHNRDGDFSRSVLRQDLEAETRTLFSAQRRLGNVRATETLEAAFADLAFSQRPLQDSEHMVQFCPFEPSERRTARRGYSFELFRLLSRLNNLRLLTAGGEQRLDPAQIAAVTRDFGKQKKITFKSLRRLLDLAPGTRFDGIAPDAEGNDVVARSGSAAEGSATLREVVGEAGWRSLLAAPGLADRVAEILSFRDDTGSIRAGLGTLGLEPAVLDALMGAVERGDFGNFTGAGHISAKAARALLPGLARGLGYAEACTEIGYDHAARAEVKIEDVRNPVARKALSEMLKQVRAVIGAFGMPDRIHVELARDVGKSAEERDEITRGIEKRNKEKDRRRAEFAEKLGHEPNEAELLRYELWKEQGGRCLYSDDPIPVRALVATDNSVQVDHILPWSRFADDSFINKTLCTARANQQKKGRTPFEWFQQDRTPGEWESFVARVEGCKEMRGRKKRGHYLRHNAAEVEERFRDRNLGDTRYATRVLAGLLARLYPADGTRHVWARPGALTAKLRRAWGLEDLKKDADGKRLADDRHHALDAIVIAATDEATLQRLTRAAQAAERAGAPRGFDFTEVAEPWPGFREAARAATEAVFVARPERRRARGEAHAATIRQVRERDGRIVVYERKRVGDLKPADLERVKDAERNAATVASLRAWLAAGKPKEAPPLSPKGDPIRKVRLATDGKVAVELRGGTADRGEMVRVDVFREPGSGKRRDRFHLVPIYPHQVADRVRWPKPPDRAVVAAKPEAEWTVVGPPFEFLFSLYGNSLIEVTKPDGEVFEGYFKGVDRANAGIAVASYVSSQQLIRGIGSKTLLSFRKLSVDRLGRISPVSGETRTWHGEACT
jgi:CRISPR-associated endonuclease Csn1